MEDKKCEITYRELLDYGLNMFKLGVMDHI